MRGLGGVYRRGQVWWVRYYRGGQEYRESARTEDKDVAVRLLHSRLAELPTKGVPPEMVTFEDLAQGYIQARIINGVKGGHLLWSKARVTNLSTIFAGMRAVDITTSGLREYAQRRLALGASPGTINRDFGVLRRMMILAVQAGSLTRRPHIPRLREAQPRQGFLEHAEYLAIRSHLPAPYRDVIDFGYRTGWRRGEILTLEWRDIDRAAGVIRLRPEASKTREGRVLVLSAPLRELIDRRWHSRGLGNPYVFHEAHTHLQGFRNAWKRACKTAGMPEKLIHDLRRTFVRNALRAGIPERVVMQMTGHKTRSIFDRYHIISERDLGEAAAKLAAYMA